MKNIDFNINNIINRLPYINYKLFSNQQNNLSNKILFNNKQENTYFILKSQGRRSYIWFTYYKDKIIAILCIINKNFNDNSNKYYYYDIDFDKTLLYNNVVIYGYYFKKNNKDYFILDCVINYNNYNKYLQDNEYSNDIIYRLSLYKLVLDNIKNSINNYIYLPYINNDINAIYNNMYNVEYQPYSISVYKNNGYLGNYILQNNNFVNKVTFLTRANIQPDSYDIYVLDRDKLVKYDYAHIDTFKTSIFMNSLFRKIKENSNLDLLETSDSEDDFENINNDKYVDLQKSINIEYKYNKIFKKWIPVNISNNNTISKTDIIKYKI